MMEDMEKNMKTYEQLQNRLKLEKETLVEAETECRKAGDKYYQEKKDWGKEHADRGYYDATLDIVRDIKTTIAILEWVLNYEEKEGAR